MNTLRQSVPDIESFGKILARYDLGDVLCKLGGLSTLRDAQSYSVRIEALTYMALSFCAGKRKISKVKLIDFLTSEYLEQLSTLEDPCEELFVYNVTFCGENYRIFPGIWGDSGFFLERILSAVEQCGGFDGDARRAIKALLMLSESMASKQVSVRYVGCCEDRLEFEKIIGHRFLDLQNYSSFRDEDIEAMGIRDDLSPFAYSMGCRRRLLDEEMANSLLESKPLVFYKKKLICVNPSFISIAIRNYVYKIVMQSEMLSRFEAEYRGFEFGVFVCDVERLMRNPTIHRRLNVERFVWGGAFAVEIDASGFAIFAYVFDDFQECFDAGLSSINENLSLDSIELDLTAVQKQLRGKCVVRMIVLGGYGRGFVGGADEAIPIGSCAFSLIAHDSDMDIYRLMKMLKQQDLMMEKGKRFINFSGLDNMVAYWKECGCNLWPPDMKYVESRDVIYISTNCVSMYKNNIYTLLDRHVVRHPESGNVLVERKNKEWLFEEDSYDCVYIPIYYWLTKGLVACIDLSSVFWVEAPAFGPKRELLYRVWSAVLHWGEKVLLSEGVREILGAQHNLKFQIEFDDECKHSENIINNAVAWEITDCGGIIYVNPNFEMLLRDVKNIAEKDLVRAFCLIVQKSVRRTIEIDAIIETLLGKKYSRMIHALNVKTNYSLFGASPNPIHIDEADLAWAELGRAETLADGALQIEGTKCRDILQAFQDALWGEIKSDLEKIDFKSLSFFALENIAALSVDEERWVATARSQLSVHNDLDEIYSIYSKESSKRVLSSLSSRVLLEMGVCTCLQSGGAEVARLKFEELLAKASLIITVGQYFEAIRNGYLPEIITASRSGIMSITGDFLDNVVHPRGSEIYRAEFNRAAEGYDQYYSVGSTSKVDEVFDANFLDAFEAEYGVSVEFLVLALKTFYNCAVDRNKRILMLNESQIQDLLIHSCDENLEQVNSYLSSFVLPLRGRWDAVDEGGYANCDWFPWKYKRRLSLMSKPILPFVEKDEQYFLVDVGFIEKAFRYIVVGCYIGDFPLEYFYSKAMKSWVGHKSDERGKSFNREVADTISACGLEVEIEVEIQHLLRDGGAKKYGDIDVFAWNSERGDVFVVECKSLSFAKTICEMIGQLNRYRGKCDRHGRPDNLMRHISRVTLVNNHLDDVARLTGIEVGKIKIHGVVVFSNKVPMMYVDCLRDSAGDIIELADFYKYYERISS